MDWCRARRTHGDWAFNICESEVQGATQTSKSLTEGSPIFLLPPSAQTLLSIPHIRCPEDHLTHPAFACDVTSLCWASNDVAFSRDRESWELPSSALCPVVGLTSLPPSYACADGTEYVPYTLVCDFRQDCLDNSDEEFCVFPPCDIVSQFQCRSKQVWQHILRDC